MTKHLFIACLIASFCGTASAKDGETTKKKDVEMPSGYMSYGVGMGYSNSTITKYNTDFYRNTEKSRSQGAFANFTADVNFILKGKGVVNSTQDGLMIGLYLPMGFGAGKARGTDIDPFWLGFKFGAGLSALYKVNDKLNFSIKEYWAMLYENVRKDGVGAQDAGMYTALGVAYGKFYFSYAHNFVPGGAARAVKPLSVLNLKYNINKGYGVEVNTEYSKGKADYRKFPGDVAHTYPYSGYTIYFGFTRIF